MSEVEKQESQKTVVAFISGLLIGGLLVWVFSSSPESAIAPEGEVKTTEEVVVEATKDAAKETTKEEVKTVAIGEGSVTVPDQAAGSVVTLGALSLPTESGWVVVRDFKNGVVGNILGAARYSVEEGLIPSSVELVRATAAGNSYQVVFFTNGGAIEFNLSEDVLIDGIATTFDANK
jgi:hypothetical protein